MFSPQSAVFLIRVSVTRIAINRCRCRRPVQPASARAVCAAPLWCLDPTILQWTRCLGAPLCSRRCGSGESAATRSRRSRSTGDPSDGATCGSAAGQGSRCARCRLPWKACSTTIGHRRASQTSMPCPRTSWCTNCSDDSFIHRHLPFTVRSEPVCASVLSGAVQPGACRAARRER